MRESDLHKPALSDLIGRVRFGLSTVSLIGANLVTIAVALSQGWRLSELVWIYWAQSCIIGLFSFLRIRNLKQFSTEGVEMDGRPVAPTPETKRKVSRGFLLHYGFFHFVYGFMLAGMFGGPTGWPLLFPLCLGVFFLNHAFSYAHNYERDRNRRPNIGTVFLFPYARIIPMHVTIILGAFMAKSVHTLVLFLVLKTVADVIMHCVEHREEKLPALSEAEGT